ncbi:hypothetical protein [Nocardia sp. NPDC057353]|uniref:hypothetical protein n=1 Tax=Nocardia sp. NPDC057353 TaxID=3346104 RepID=UPI0036334CC0
MSCDSDPAPTAEPAPPTWAVSFRWTADSGIDLDDREGVHVRAAIESNTIADFLEMENAYPGWADYPGAIDIDARETKPAQSAVGTAYLHLIDYRRPNGLNTLVVCKDMTQVAVEQSGSFPLPSLSDDHNTFEAVAVDIIPGPIPRTRQKPTEPPAGPNLNGPAGRTARPARDVFDLPVQVYYPHGGGQYRSLCESWDRWKPGTPLSRSETEPPPIEPFTPGWN